MAFLLQHMFPSLTQAERQDFSAQLAVLSTRAGAEPVPISLENGVLLPPVPLCSLPTVLQFQPQPLPPNLAPYPRRNSPVSSGPFLFNPVSFGGGSARSSGRGGGANVTWVAGDVGEGALTLLNPLPTELKVPNLSLLHEGPEFEAFPSSLSLAPQSAPYNVGLHGVAAQPGTLKLLGYSHNVLGNLIIWLQTVAFKSSIRTRFKMPSIWTGRSNKGCCKCHNHPSAATGMHTLPLN